MQRQNVIVISMEDEVEVYGNLKKACEAKGLTYNTLRLMSFPIKKGNFIIRKVKFN